MCGRKKICGCLVWGECGERQEKGMTKVQEKSFGGDISVQCLDFGHDFMGVMSVQTWYIYRHLFMLKQQIYTIMMCSYFMSAMSQ